MSSSLLVSISLSDPACLAPCLYVFSCLLAHNNPTTRAHSHRAFQTIITCCCCSVCIRLFRVFSISSISSRFGTLSNIYISARTSDLYGSDHFSPFRPSTFIRAPHHFPYEAFAFRKGHVTTSVVGTTTRSYIIPTLSDLDIHG